MRYVCVATPVFAGHWFGDGFTAEAAQLAPAVVWERAAMARFLAEAVGVHGPFPHHTLPLSPALYECIYGSLAYGLLPLMHIASALDNGRLVDLAPGKSLDVPLEWHAWQLDTPFTKALSEQVIGSARRYLLQP
jgi:LysR family transcriptional regulator (chromosome initiation inhibitor)